MGLDEDSSDVIVLSANKRLDFDEELSSGGRGRSFYSGGFRHGADNVLRM